MRHAEMLRCPLVTLIDTPGACPGLHAEEENQSGAIAHTLALLSRLRTAVVAIVVGEGGSGGALALGRRRSAAHAREHDLLGHQP